MGNQETAELIRRGIEALNSQDYDTMMDLLADDVVWHMIGVPEPAVGKEAIAAGLGGGSSDFNIDAELHDVTVSDDHIIALVRAHATRGDESLDYNTAEIFHFRDGKITERWAFSDDTARIVAFFA